MFQPHATIDKAKNGYTVSLAAPDPEAKNKWEFHSEEYIYTTFEEAVGAVVAYFNGYESADS